MDVLALLVTLVILGLVFYVVQWAVAQIPLPPPFAVVVRVVLALAAVLVVLGLLFGGIVLPVLRFRA
jgi:hypothetical protein